MSVELESLALGLLAGLAFAAATSLAVTFAWPLLRALLPRLEPSRRARIVWLAATSPSVLPALLVALCFLPGVLASAGFGEDHCLRHPGHAHLCLRHANVPLTHAGGALLALCGALATVAVVREALRVMRTRRWLAGLRPRAKPYAPDVAVLPSAKPFAFTAGLWRPRIHLAASLLESLPSPQLAAVIEHERAHARRRDPLARLAARLLSIPLLPPLRRALLREHSIACEQACDAEAGRRIGDRLTVAEAILAVERSLAGAAPARAGIAGFDEGGVALRVRALVAAEPAPPRRGAWAFVALHVLLVAFAFSDALHHATEHLLAHLAR